MIDFVFALIGFTMGWFLAVWLGRRYDPARREPEGGGA